MSRTLLKIFVFLLVSVILFSTAYSYEDKRINPHPDVSDDLEIREQLEKHNLENSNFSHDIEFKHFQNETGIDFEHNTTPEMGIDWKPNHYGHGTGVASADINNNGRQDLYFVNQLGPNQMWINEGDGKFSLKENEELEIKDKISSGASFADVNNNGYPDLYVTNIREPNYLYRNHGGEFRRISEPPMSEIRSHSISSLFFDYNNNGKLDLLVLNLGEFTNEGEEYHKAKGIGMMSSTDESLNEKSRLYENKGNFTFKDVTEETNLNSERSDGTATPMYLEGNQYPGLYITDMSGPDRYYRNIEGEKFVEVTEEKFDSTPFGSMDARLINSNNNQEMELYVTDMHSDMLYNKNISQEDKKLPEHMVDHLELPFDKEDLILGNAFYADNFSEEKSIEKGLENYWPWGFSRGDFNANGYQDLFVTSSMNYNFYYKNNHLLLNDKGQGFHKAEFSTGIEPRADNRTHTLWYKIDCKSSNHRKCEDYNGTLEVEGPLGSRGSVAIDLDNNGALDIVTNEFNSKPQVLKNKHGDAENNYIKVSLEGTNSNRDGLGAKVEVQTENETYMRYNQGRSGYLSQSSKPMYFGLGKQEKIKDVEVSWPSGKTTYHNVDEINQEVTLVEKGTLEMILDRIKRITRIF